MIYRWAVAIFYVFCVVFAIVTNVNRGQFHVFFIYLTNLNQLGTMVATCLSAYLVTSYHFSPMSKEYQMSSSLKIYWALWNQSMALSLIVTSFYWLTIHDGNNIDVNNILGHVTNVIVLTIDMLIVKHPPKYSNFVAVLGVVALYSIFTAVFQFSGGLNA